MDISLLSLATLGVLDPKDPRMIATAHAVREELWLKTPIEGCARYQGDVYQRAEDSPKDIPGNPWFISTLWLAEYAIDQAENQQELQAAIPYLEWCGNNTLPSEVLAEQVHPSTVPFFVCPLLPGVILLYYGPSSDTRKRPRCFSMDTCLLGILCGSFRCGFSHPIICDILNSERTEPMT
ncbi:MAG: glycoside hydrolase family 15 protein [Nitrospirales bacterium]